MKALKLKTSSQSHGEWQVETRRQIDDRRLQEVGIVRVEIKLAELIWQTQTPVVRDVEEVGDEADARAFIDHPRIVCMQIQLAVERRASQLTTTANGNFAGVQINRVWKKLADRYARFHVETQAEVQTIQQPAVEAGAVVAETVAGINVRNEATVRVERSNRKLITE